MERSSVTLMYEVNNQEALEICAKFDIVPEVTTWNNTPIASRSLTIKLPHEVKIEYWVEINSVDEWYTYWNVVLNERNELVAERSEKECL